MSVTQQPWEQIVSQKRSARDRLLAPYVVDHVEGRLPRTHRVEERSHLEDPEVQRITEIDNVMVLLELLQTGELAAEQVVTAYIKR